MCVCATQVRPSRVILIPTTVRKTWRQWKSSKKEKHENRPPCPCISWSERPEEDTENHKLCAGKSPI